MKLLGCADGAIKVKMQQSAIHRCRSKRNLGLWTELTDQLRPHAALGNAIWLAAGAAACLYSLFTHQIRFTLQRGSTEAACATSSSLVAAELVRTSASTASNEGSTMHGGAILGDALLTKGRC